MAASTVGDPADNGPSYSSSPGIEVVATRGLFRHGNLNGLPQPTQAVPMGATFASQPRRAGRNPAGSGTP